MASKVNCFAGFCCHCLVTRVHIYAHCYPLFLSGMMLSFVFSGSHTISPVIITMQKQIIACNRSSLSSLGPLVQYICHRHLTLEVMVFITCKINA